MLSILRNNNIKKFLFILLSCLIIFGTIATVSTINAEAAGQCPVCGEFHPGGLNGIGRFFYDACCAVYGGELFSLRATGTDKLTTVDVLRFDVIGDENFSDLWSGAEIMYDAVAVFGQILAIVHLLAFLMEESISDNLNPEQFMKIFIKFVIGIIVIKNGFEIAGVCLTFSAVLFNAISSPISKALNADACNYEMMKNGGMAAIFNALSLMVPYAIMMVVKAVVSIICWFRLFDVLVRVIFCPVGMSDLVFEGTQGHGFTYLKKMIASAMQGAVIIAITKAYSALLGLINGATGWIIPCILAICVMITIFKSSSYANDVMGTA